MLKKFVAYDELTETDNVTNSNSDIVLSGEALEKLPMLIAELEKKSAPYLEKMQNIQPKRVVAEFAQVLMDLGEQYANKPVSDYGNEIINASKAFNVEKEKWLIKQFGHFVEKLRDQLKS